MIVLDIPRKFSGSHLDVPGYHRAHLALSPEAEVHLCLLPRHLAAVGVTRAVPLPELIVSPIAFAHWATIWRLTLYLRERIGLVHDVYDVLRRHEINVLAAESTNMEEQRLHYIEMLVDVAEAHGRSATNNAARRVQRVEWSLLARLFDDVVFDADGTPRLKIRQVQTLAHAREVYLQGLEADNLPFKPMTDTARARLAGAPGQRTLRIPLPSDMRKAISSATSRAADQTFGSDHGYYLRVSDTRDRFLRTFFFRSADAVIHARIEHNEERGALAAITGALREQGFDLLTSYCSLYEHRKRATFEIVARVERLQGQGTDALKAHLQRTLGSPHCADYQLEIGYPKNYGSKWDRKKILPGQPELDFGGRRADVERDDGATWTPSLAAELEARHANLAKKLQEGLFDSHDRFAWTLVTQLIRQHATWSGAAPSRALFVSCHFSNPRILQRTRSIAEEPSYGFRAVDGRNLTGYDTKTAGLIALIGSCTHYVGIWSLDGATPHGTKYWPSPWLLWELGVACALGLEWRLLIADGIDPSAWEKIRQDRQHQVYGEESFDEGLRSVLAELARASGPTLSSNP